MRITTRIGLGLLLMAGLLIGTLTYQLSLVDRLQGINRELSHTSLEASQIAVHLVQGLDGVREFAAKASALGDEDYRTQWRDWERAVEGELARLAEVGLSEPEEEARARIVAGWRQYQEVAPQAWGDPVGFMEVEEALADIRLRVGEFMDVNEAIVTDRVETSAEAGEEARFVAWAAAGSALLLAALVSGLLFLSISGPLRHLTRGTREVARGRFDHRLDVGGPEELSSLARDFNHMAARLDELEDLKRDFVSHVSHELKTPLAAIQETVEVLLDGLAGPLTEKQEHLLALSRTSTDRLSSMITNLLEMSRLEAGATTYHPEVHDPVRIVDSVVEEMGPLVRDRGVRIEVAAEGGARAILCDGARFRDVAANLISNAIKFSPQEGRIGVQISEPNRSPPVDPGPGSNRPPLDQGPYVLLSVEDKGPGIPDEDKEKVFEKFHQVGRRERVRGQQGVGLGLAISRRIVEAHGGRIWAADRPEGGTVFHVLLPTTPSRWRDQPATHAGTPPPRSTDDEDSAAPAARTGTHPLVLLLVATLPLAGCASSGAEESTPGPAPDHSLPTIEVSGEPPAETRVEEGRALLVEGRYEDAAIQFDRILSRDDGAGEPAALLGLALVHLLPDSPFTDRDRGERFLTVLEEDHPATIEAVHARWAHQTLRALQEAEERTAEQERQIQELNETLERLRQIDLERQPSGTPRAPP